MEPFHYGKVERVSNRTARVMTYSNYDVDGGHLFNYLGWKHLTGQQRIQRATIVYKSLQGLR